MESSQCSGAGTSQAHPWHMANTNAILLTSLPYDLHTIPASHGWLEPVMWLRCALDDFTTYPIFQSVSEVCQWDSLGMTTDYPTGNPPSPENPLLLLPLFTVS